MPQYVPILKSKDAEHRAWQQANSSVVVPSRPIFVVVSEGEPTKDLNAFIARIRRCPPLGVGSVDTGYIDQQLATTGSTDRAILWTARALLLHGIVAKPVMRLEDDPLVLSEVAAAVSLHRQGACLRLGSDNDFLTIIEASRLWPNVRQETGLPAAEVDLLIDLGAVESQQAVSHATGIATQMLHWAYQNGPWRSVAVASGAFPRSTSNLSVGGASPVHRFDADLFANVIAGNPPIIPDFGDYAIWHPRLPSEPGYRPMPNLRYANQREWQVYRERRIRPGNESFYTLCGKVVGSRHWPTTGAHYSFGDAEIERCSLEVPGPGTAAHWLQWGASHHFAHVVDRLTTQGVP